MVHFVHAIRRNVKKDDKQESLSYPKKTGAPIETGAP
jgi:hypothetical protein